MPTPYEIKLHDNPENSGDTNRSTLSEESTPSKGGSIDILFLDGLGPRYLKWIPSYLSFLYTIASVLEKEHFTFKIANVASFDGYSPEEMVNTIRSVNCRTIGISVNSDNVSHVYATIALLKQHLPSTPIILGGPQVTFSDLKTLERCECDIVVRHEGEQTLVSLLQYYCRGAGHLELIKGITYRSGSDLKRTDDAPLVDLDSLPTPQYRILVDPSYWVIPAGMSKHQFDGILQVILWSHLYFISSRGCPYRCIFCVEGSLQRGVRVRRIEYAIRDLDNFLRVTGLQFFAFSDDIFTASKARVAAFCEFLRNQRDGGRNLTWYAEARADIISKQPDFLSLMYESGLRKLQFGVESGNESMMMALGKRLTKDEVRTATRLCSTYPELSVRMSFIIGGPGETKRTVCESIEFAKELIQLSFCRIDFTVSHLTPFVGTPIRESPERFGIEILEPEFELSSSAFSSIVCKPKEMSVAELSDAIRLFRESVSKHHQRTFWSLPKHEIDKAFLSLIDNQQGTADSVTQIWRKTLIRYPWLSDYYRLLHSESSVRTYDVPHNEEHAELVPLRTTDGRFDPQTGLYTIKTVRQPITLSGAKAYLWKSATGRMNVRQIALSPENPNYRQPNAVHEAVDFYRSLEREFVLVFRAF